MGEAVGEDSARERKPAMVWIPFVAMLARVEGFWRGGEGEKDGWRAGGASPGRLGGTGFILELSIRRRSHGQVHKSKAELAVGEEALAHADRKKGMR